MKKLLFALKKIAAGNLSFALLRTSQIQSVVAYQPVTLNDALAQTPSPAPASSRRY